MNLLELVVDIATNTKKSVRELGKVERKFDDATRAAQRTDKATDGFTKSAASAATASGILGVKVKDLGSEFTVGTLKATNFTTNLTRMDKRLTGIAKRAGEASRSMLVLSAGAALVTKQVVDTSAKFEGWERAFTAITGTPEGAADQLEYAKGVADRFGSSLAVTTDTWKDFSASVKGTELADEAKNIFETFTAVSQTLDTTPAELEGVLKALRDMVSKGTVQAEELKGQLGDRLPGAFQAAAKAMGVTTQELGKMMAAGKITAEELLPKLAQQMREDYGLDLSKRMEGSRKSFQRLNNSLMLLRASIGDSGLVDSLADLAVAATKMVDAFADAPPWVHKLAGSLLVLTAASTPLLFVFGKLAAGAALIYRVASAFKVLNAVSKGQKLVGFIGFFRKNKGVLNALKVMRGGFKLLGVVMGLLSAKIMIIGAAIATVGLLFNDAWVFMKGGKSVIGDLVKKFKEMRIMERIGDTVNKAFDKVKEGIGSMWESARDKFPKTTKAVEDLGTAFGILGKYVWKETSTTLARAWDSVKSGFKGVYDTVKGYIDQLVTAWNNLITSFTDNALVKAASDLGGMIGDGISTGLDAAGEKLKGLTSNIGATLTGALDTTLSGITQVVSAPVLQAAQSVSPTVNFGDVVITNTNAGNVDGNKLAQDFTRSIRSNPTNILHAVGGTSTQ